MHVAIVGCGQLARMLALAGWRMGWRFSFIADGAESTQCIEGLGRVVRYHRELNAQELYRLLDSPDVITVERETVDTDLLRTLAVYCPVYPNPEAVHVCQNRQREKAFLNALGLPTAPWRSATTIPEIDLAAEQLGLPLVIKTDEAGYDGKNQWYIDSLEKLRQFKQQYQGTAVTAEGWVNFQREVSLIAARSSNGEIKCYPLTENVHVNGTLLTSVAPAEHSEGLQAKAAQIAQRLLREFDYVGILAVEFFVIDGDLVINELAPRVHNSYHWTQNSVASCQFDNHLRAIAGLPLGITDLRGVAAMFNILHPIDESSLRRQLSPYATLHLYNKTPRTQRKLGHINLQHELRGILIGELDRLRQALPQGDL